MLDRLLDFGWPSPALLVTLEYVPPVAWVRLAQSSTRFRTFLRNEGTTGTCPACSTASCTRNSLHEILDEATSAALDGRHSRTVCVELAGCEAAFSALMHGADVNEVQSLTGMTPLMRVAEEGWLRFCQLLLSRRADADRLSVGEATALSLALGGFGSWYTRPAVAQLLLHHTSVRLPEACAVAVRLALQDNAYLPVMSAFVSKRSVAPDAEIRGPDCRVGTLLSVALEGPVLQIEAGFHSGNRARVVAELLRLRADPSRPGPYSSWLGGKLAASLVGFAAANGCDQVTLALLGATDTRQQQL